MIAHQPANKPIARSVSGHRCGESHQRAVLTDADVREMRRLHQEEKVGYKKLKKLFGCGESTARDIVLYRTRWSA